MSSPYKTAEPETAYAASATRTAEIKQGGRIVIPAEFRKALDIHEGDKLLVRVQDGELRITTRRAQIQEARKKFQALFPDADGRCWSDELIAERRAEAARE